MPRELTPDEKARNKQMLVDKGRALVYQYGIKKVSVDDVVASAGIAKGSFYITFHLKMSFSMRLFIRSIANYLVV